MTVNQEYKKRTDEFSRVCLRGFTIIEIVIFIVMAGIFVPVAYIAFSSAVREGATPESITKARFIAEQKMENLTKDIFDNITITSTSYAAVPGYTGYQWKWTVSYITYSGDPPVISDTGSATNYKKIIVYVKEPRGYEYTVYTIVSKRPA